MFSEKDLFEQGLGNVTWWGFSPTFDIASEIKGDDDKSRSILLLGTGDGRHIYPSIADCNGDHDVHFYIFEQNLLLYARQMLLTQMLKACGQKSDKEREETAKEFLEVFGNITLRPETARRVQEISQKLGRNLIQLHSNPEESDFPELDCSKLKSKELDVLEKIFKFWSESKSTENLDLTKHWDFRLRQLLTDRFDAKQGIFEMDYQLRLVDRGGANISHKEYCHWRNSGNAYIWIDEALPAKRTMHYRDPNDQEEEEEEEVEQICSNPTLISSLEVDSGSKTEARKGFWGDIVSGPFFNFGFEFSTEVQITRTKVDRISQENALNAVVQLLDGLKDKNGKWPKMTFMSISSTERDLLSKEKYSGKFHSAFLACSVTHLLGGNFPKCLKPGAPIYVESPLYLLHIAKEVQDKFRDHFVDLCDALQLCIDPEFDTNPKNVPLLKITHK